MDHIDFIRPVHLGDLVTLKSSVNRAFTSSMEVGVKVWAENTQTGELLHVASAYLVFVAIDEHGQPAEGSAADAGDAGRDAPLCRCAAPPRASRGGSRAPQGGAARPPRRWKKRTGSLSLARNSIRSSEFKNRSFKKRSNQKLWRIHLPCLRRSLCPAFQRSSPSVPARAAWAKPPSPSTWPSRSRKLGQRVGLIDADIYGPNVPLMMGSTQQPRVGAGQHASSPTDTHGIKTISIGYISPGDKPLVMRGPMLHQIIRQFLQQVDWGELDYLIVDLPPGTGDVVISLVQTVPLTGAVVVSTPSDVSLQDARKALEMFAQVNVEVLGIVENMSHFTCPHCHQEIDIFSRGGAERTAKQFDVPFLGSIELVPAIREGGDRGLPVALAGPKSPQAAEFYAVAEKLMEQAEAAAAAATDVIEIS